MFPCYSTCNPATTIRWYGVTLTLPPGWSNPQGRLSQCGEGIHAVVFKVLDPQQQPWALKLFKSTVQQYGPYSPRPALPPRGQLPLELQMEINFSIKCKEFDNPVTTLSLPGISCALVKTFITGPTLKDLVEAGAFAGDSTKPNPYLLALTDLLTKMSAKKIMVKDLNPANIIFHQIRRQWVVIDGDFHGYASTADEALAYNIQSLTKQLRCTTPAANNFIRSVKSCWGHGRNRPWLTNATAPGVRDMLLHLDALHLDDL